VPSGSGLASGAIAAHPGTATGIPDRSDAPLGSHPWRTSFCCPSRSRADQEDSLRPISLESGDIGHAWRAVKEGNGMAPTEEFLEIGAAVQRIRVARAMTQQELANAAGLKTGFISKIEGGFRLPSGPTLQRLSEALRVPP